MKTWIGFAVGGALALLVVGHAQVAADHRQDGNSASGVEWRASSQHSGEHSGTCTGINSAYASHHTMPESEHVPSVSGGVQDYVLKKRGRLIYAAPFTGIQRTSSEHTSTYRGGHSDNPGWMAFMSTRKNWSRVMITGSDGLIVVFYGDQNTVSATTIAAHTLFDPEMNLPVVASPPESSTPLVANFYDNGIPEFDVNGDMVFDQNGNVQYDVPPTLVARFTSSMEASGSTTTFNYLVENFEDDARTFSIPQVTTSQYPSGWTGTVAGNGTSSTAVSALGETTYYQNCQIDLQEMLMGGTYSLPSKMYVPYSRLSYDGSVTLDSITYNPSLGNVVSATQFGDVATKAVLWLIDSGGDHRLIAEEEGSWGPEASLSLIDPDPAEGTNTYYVMTGVEPNGYASDAVSIVN